MKPTRSSIVELYDEYSFLLDEGDYEAWLQLFSSESDYRVVSRENWERGLPLATLRCDSPGMLADRIDAIRNTQFYVHRTMRHFVTALRVGRDTGRLISVTANFLVTESMPDEPARVHTVGQYRDEIIIEADELRFRHKLAVYDAPIVLNSLVVPL